MPTEKNVINFKVSATVKPSFYLYRESLILLNCFIQTVTFCYAEKSLTGAIILIKQWFMVSKCSIQEVKYSKIKFKIMKTLFLFSKALLVFH